MTLAQTLARDVRDQFGIEATPAECQHVITRTRRIMAVSIMAIRRRESLHRKYAADVRAFDRYMQRESR